MTPDSAISQRKRIVSYADRPRDGHRLLEIEERLLGQRPTDIGRSLTDGPTYRTRYWRCRQCGQERSSQSAFGHTCPAQSPLTPKADGGYFVADPRTRTALTADLRVQHVGPGDVYTVSAPGKITHRVDLRAESCTCPDYRLENAYCVHLRRVDIEVRTGTVPRMD